MLEEKLHSVTRAQCPDKSIETVTKRKTSYRDSSSDDDESDKENEPWRSANAQRTRLAPVKTDRHIEKIRDLRSKTNNLGMAKHGGDSDYECHVPSYRTEIGSFDKGERHRGSRDEADVPYRPGKQRRVFKYNDSSSDEENTTRHGRKQDDQPEVGRNHRKSLQRVETPSDGERFYRRPRKEWLPVEKYDGTTSWQAFATRFELCSEYNGWGEIDKIAHLQACLKGGAEQILWEEGNKRWTFQQLFRKLERRFGSEGQANLYRAELNMRRREKGESLQSLSQDISRLVALSFAGPRSPHADILAIEAFLKALDDEEMAIKIRELEPVNLDAAFKHAQRLESYKGGQKVTRTNDDTRWRNRRDDHYVRATADSGPNDNTRPKGAPKANNSNRNGNSGANANESNAGSGEMQAIKEALHSLQNQVAQNSANSASLPNNAPAGSWGPPPSWSNPQCPPVRGSVPPLMPYAGPPPMRYAGPPPGWNANPGQSAGNPPTGRHGPNATGPLICYGCQQPGHVRRNCPQNVPQGAPNTNLSMVRADFNTNRDVYSYAAGASRNAALYPGSRSYLPIEIDGVRHIALLDSGSEMCIMPYKFVGRLQVVPTDRRLFGAGGHRIPVAGSVRMTVKLGGFALEADALVARSVNEVILGIDWLIRHQISWQFGEGSIGVRGYQFLLLTKESENLSCRRCLIVNKDTCLPARCETNVQADFQPLRHDHDRSGSLGEDWATETLELKRGLLVTRAVLPRREANVPIRLMNIGDEEIFLRGGSEVAEAVPVSVEQPEVVQENQRDWDERLQSVMAAYRASPQESTGFSPNFVLLGRECRAPLDLLLGPPPSEEHAWGSTDDFVYHQQQIKRDAYRLVRDHLGVAAERSKHDYDMRVHPVKFRVGDWVYVYYPRRFLKRSPKWTSVYTGPFLIVKQLNVVNFVVQRTSKSATQVIHVDKMRKCLGDTPRSWIVMSNDDTLMPTAPADVREDQPALQDRHSETLSKVSDSFVSGEGNSQEPNRVVREDGVNHYPVLLTRPRRKALYPRRYLKRTRSGACFASSRI